MKSPPRTRRSGILLAAVCAAVGLLDSFLTVIGEIAPVRQYLIAAFVFGGLTFAVSRWRAPHGAAVLALAAAAFVTLLAWWPWHGRKDFFRDVDALSIGAARADVQARMASWPEGHPFGDESFANFHANDPRVDQWHHNGASRMDSFDHVVVHYDEHDRVSGIERIVD